jgi:hypothetical protein
VVGLQAAAIATRIKTAANKICLIDQHNASDPIAL